MLVGSWSTFWSALFAEKTETGNFSRNLFCQNQRSIIWVLFKTLGCLIWSAFRVKWIIRANLTWKRRFSSVSRGNCSKLICLNLLLLWFSDVVRRHGKIPVASNGLFFKWSLEEVIFLCCRFLLQEQKYKFQWFFLYFIFAEIDWFSSLNQDFFSHKRY